MWEVAKNSPQLLGWLCESQGSSLGKNTFFFPFWSPKLKHLSLPEEKPRARNIILQPQMAWSLFKPQKHGGQLGRRKDGQAVPKKANQGVLGRESTKLSWNPQSGLKQ